MFIVWAVRYLSNEKFIVRSQVLPHCSRQLHDRAQHRHGHTFVFNHQTTAQRFHHAFVAGCVLSTGYWRVRDACTAIKSTRVPRKHRSVFWGPDSVSSICWNAVVAINVNGCRFSHSPSATYTCKRAIGQISTQSMFCACPRNKILGNFTKRGS